MGHVTLAQSLWVSYDSLTVTDFCRNKNPHPPMEVVRQCIPALLALLQKGDNEIDGEQGSDLWSMSTVNGHMVGFMFI